jgi:Ca2+-binding EF-hand superfamily protein
VNTLADTTDYAATFELVDTDGDGRISAGELVRLMRALGDEISEERADAAVRRLDGDGDGRISLEELSAYLREERSTGSA